MTTYHESEWPHGLRCMDCNHRLQEGEAYSERLDGFVGDTPICELICASCALKAAVG